MQLLDLSPNLEPGMPLVVHCRTTDKVLDTSGLPSAYHRERIPYVLRGVFDHYRLTPTPACIVIRSGESGKMQHVYMPGIERIHYDAETILADLV